MNVDPRFDEIDDCLYRVAVKAFIIDRGRVLLVKDAGDKGWSFPGGGIDHGESAQTALKRELAEELGIEQENVSMDGKVAYVDVGHAKNGIPRCNIFYFVELDNFDFVLTNEVDERSWFEISEIDLNGFDKSTGNPKEIIEVAKSRTR